MASDLRRTVAADTVRASLWMGVRIIALAGWLLSLAHVLTPEGFGWIASLLAVSAVCTLLVPLGVPYLFFAGVHQDRGADSEGCWRQAVGTVLTMGPILSGAGAILLLLWIGSLIPAALLFLFLLMDITLSALVQTGALFLHARGRLGSASGLPALLSVSRALAALLVLLIDQSAVPAYLAAHLAATLIVAALTAWRLAGFGLDFFGPRLPVLATLRKSAAYALMGAGSIFSSELDKPLVARVLGLGVAGVYSIAYRVAATLATPATALAAAMLPRWAAMAEAGSRAQLRRSFLGTLAFAVLLGAFFMVVLKAAGAARISESLGDYAEVMDWLDRLAWIVAAVGAHQVAGTALIAAGKPVVRTIVDAGCYAGLVMMLPCLHAGAGLDGVAFAVIATEATAACAMAIAFIAFPCRPASPNLAGGLK